MSQRSFYDLFPVTSLLGLLVLGFFILEVIANNKFDGGLVPLAGGFDPKVTFFMGSMHPRAILENGQYWRLLTCVFLHGNLLHLFFNAMVLVDLGRFCEPLLSGPKFFTVYVLSGLGSSLLSLGWAIWGDPHSSVGASGSLSGLIGLMLVYSIKERHPQLREALVRWIIFIVVIGMIVPHIDNAGHLGGFIVGGLLGLTVKQYTTSAAVARWTYPAYAAGAVVAGCLAMGLWSLFRELF